MEDLNTKGANPVFKKIDRAVFEQIDKFKQTPNYAAIHDQYNGLDEEQQKIAKGLIIVALFAIPLFFLSFLYFQNTSLRSDLEKRTSIIARAQQIIGQGQSVRAVAPQILSMNPIDSQSMMTSRLSTLLSTMGVDLSKIQVNQFSSSMVSSLVMRSEADFAFSSVTTDELMNIFIGMIQRERFRVESVNIERNAETNTLQGQFHAIHFSQVSNAEEE
jgi:hypothetical protein